MPNAGYLALSRELADMAAALERPMDDTQREEAQEVIGWARLALQTGPAWSPIASAPKNGAPILAYVRFARGGHVVEIKWDLQAKEWVTAHPARVVLPSHWMPRPKPPHAVSAPVVRKPEGPIVRNAESP